MFVLNSEITIGTFKIKGVHDVRIKRSLKSYINTAFVKLPSIAVISKKDGTKEKVITGKQFKDGDLVTIKLGYNGKLYEEFKGFVKRRNLNMPLEVECEGYSYQLRNNNPQGFWTKANASTILKEAIKGTDITLKIDQDIELLNVKTNKECTGADLLDLVLKASKGALNAFFIEPTVLWIGFVYLPAGDALKDALQQPQVKYRLGYNVEKDNNLRERVPVDVVINILNRTAKRDRGAAPKPVLTGKQKTIIANHISDAGKKNVEESLVTKESYTGYEGTIRAFLFPLCYPGYKAFIKDTRYKERDGSYLVESIEVLFGQNGARRVIEIGPKIQVS